MSIIRASRALAVEAARSHKRDRCGGPANCPLCAAILDVEVELTRPILPAAAALCEIYFKIAAAAIGVKEVQRLREEAIAKAFESAPVPPLGNVALCPERKPVVPPVDPKIAAQVWMEKQPFFQRLPADEQVKVQFKVGDLKRIIQAAYNAGYYKAKS